MHGANRLGGNGVANSTVFGGIAGDTMAAWVAREGEWREPDESAIEAAFASAESPFAAHKDGADLESIRERLLRRCGTTPASSATLRDCARAQRALAALAAELARYSLPEQARDRAFNLAWHDWLNLKSLVAVSRAIVCAALGREDSRGAHYRSDFPASGDVAASTHTRVRARDGELSCEAVPVRFTRVQPG